MRVVFGVLLCMVLSALGATAQQISLHGPHAVTVAEDDPGFADPDYDDSHWPRMPLPGNTRHAGYCSSPAAALANMRIIEEENGTLIDMRTAQATGKLGAVRWFKTSRSRP